MNHETGAEQDKTLTYEVKTSGRQKLKQLAISIKALVDDLFITIPLRLTSTARP